MAREAAPHEVATLSEIERLTPPPFVIEGILPRPGVAIIGGAPKMGKSVLAFGATVDAVRSSPVFGLFGSNIQRAFYFNAEGGTLILKSREQSWQELTIPQRDNILVSGRIVKVTDSTGKLDEGIIDAVAHYIRQHVGLTGVDLVVFDPLVYFHAGDENKNDHMQHAMEGFARIARRLNCGVLVVHHANKRSSDVFRETRPGGRDLRGADAVFAAADGVIIVTGDLDGEDRQLYLDLRHGASCSIPMRFNKALMRFERQQ